MCVSGGRSAAGSGDDEEAGWPMGKGGERACGQMNTARQAATQQQGDG